MADRKQALDTFVNGIRPFFEQQGFAIRRFKEAVVFERLCEGITSKYSFDVLTEYGLDVEPQLSVRHEETERIYHIVSGLPREGQESTATLCARVGYIMEAQKPWWMIFPVWDKVRMPLESDGQVRHAVTKQIEFFKKCGGPTLELYSTLQTIDHHLNDKPTKPALLAGERGVFRSTRGIIVAKLVGRPDFEKLVAIHRKAVEWQERGRHLPAYNLLVKILSESSYQIPKSSENH